MAEIAFAERCRRTIEDKSLKAEDRLAFSSRVFHMESIRKLYLLIQAPGDNARLIVRDIEDRPPSAKGGTLTTVGPKGGK